MMSSEVLVGITESAAIRVEGVVAFVLNWLVANVAEKLLAHLARNEVVGAIFLINLTAFRVWTHCAHFEIYPLNVLISEFLNDFFGDLCRKNRSLIRPVIRVLFVMLLSLGRCSALPTHILKALDTLHLGAT